MFADLRRPWIDKLFVGDASHGWLRGCERRCPGHEAAEIGRQSERWRWDDEEAIRAHEHALDPHGVVTVADSVTFSEVPSNLLTSGT